MNALAYYRRISGSMCYATLHALKSGIEVLRRSPTPLDMVPLVVADQWEVEHLARPLVRCRT